MNVSLNKDMHYLLLCVIYMAVLLILQLPFDVVAYKLLISRIPF